VYREEDKVTSQAFRKLGLYLYTDLPKPPSDPNRNYLNVVNTVGLPPFPPTYDHYSISGRVMKPNGHWRDRAAPPGRRLGGEGVLRRRSRRLLMT
jgi:hypothetical protein